MSPAWLCRNGRFWRSGDRQDKEIASGESGSEKGAGNQTPLARTREPDSPRNGNPAHPKPRDECPSVREATGLFRAPSRRCCTPSSPASNGALGSRAGRARGSPPAPSLPTALPRCILPPRRACGGVLSATSSCAAAHPRGQPARPPRPARRRTPQLHRRRYPAAPQGNAPAIASTIASAFEHTRHRQ
jgi:hypothetical protein